MSVNSNCRFDIDFQFGITTKKFICTRLRIWLNHLSFVICFFYHLLWRVFETFFGGHFMYWWLHYESVSVNKFRLILQRLRNKVVTFYLRSLAQIRAFLWFNCAEKSEYPEKIHLSDLATRNHLMRFC